MRYFLLLALVGSLAAQTWTEMPVNGVRGHTAPGSWPWVAGYNRAVYDPNLKVTFVRDRINTCGDPFTNSDWHYSTASNTYLATGWSGAGTNPGGACTVPIVDPDPISYPGDRHPFHQYTYLNGAIWLTGGVEDARKCDDSAKGICNFADLWRRDDSTLLWSKMANAPFSVSEGVLEADPDTNQLYIFGGLVAGNASNFVTQYDVASNTWTRLSPSGVLPPISDAVSMVYDPAVRKFVLWGGGTCVTCGPSNRDIYLYDPSSNTFTKPSPLNPPPADKFPKMDYDAKRNLVIVYVAGSGVYGYSAEANIWTNLNVPGGPTLYNNLRNSLSMAYDSDTDMHIASAASCMCVWKLNLP